MRPLGAALVALALAAPSSALGQPDSAGDGGATDGSARDREVEAQELYASAVQQWRRRDPSAWMLFRAIAEDTRAGRRAAELLEGSDAHYRAGLDHFGDGRDEQARRAFERGTETGPMDPHHYLELGDIYRNRGLRIRAIAWYGRWLAFINRSGETVPQETLNDVYDYIDEAAEDEPVPEIEEPPPSPWIVAAPIVGLLAILAAAIFIAWLRRGRTLEELVEESPDLHPRIAYAIGCLRHELLKHRLGAIGDAVAALRTGKLGQEQLTYLRDRLYGGDSLDRLWTIYLETFDRLGGRRLNLKGKDREFRRAGTALRTLERLRSRFAAPDAQLAERLDAQRTQIAQFDRHLRYLSERLSRTKVDGQLLREAVFSVQGEPRAASIRVDEIRFGEPPEELHVEVFRTDLLIVLRNLVRNAIFAVGRQRKGRRAVGIEVDLRTEPTGDESVLIKVLDTSPESISTDDIYGKRLDHGLGLAAAAVTRYDGSLFVVDAGGDWNKGVVVRLFRALGENG